MITRIRLRSNNVIYFVKSILRLEDHENQILDDCDLTFLWQLEEMVVNYDATQGKFLFITLLVIQYYSHRALQSLSITVIEHYTHKTLQSQSITMIEHYSHRAFRLLITVVLGKTDLQDFCPLTVKFEPNQYMQVTFSDRFNLQ